MEDSFGYFYLRTKLHKTLISTRPVCSGCASLPHALVDGWMIRYNQQLQHNRPISRTRLKYYELRNNCPERVGRDLFGFLCINARIIYEGPKNVVKNNFSQPFQVLRRFLVMFTQESKQVSNNSSRTIVTQLVVKQDLDKMVLSPNFRYMQSHCTSTSQLKIASTCWKPSFVTQTYIEDSSTTMHQHSLKPSLL